MNNEKKCDKIKIGSIYLLKQLPNALFIFCKVELEQYSISTIHFLMKRHSLIEVMGHTMQFDPVSTCVENYIRHCDAVIINVDFQIPNKTYELMFPISNIVVVSTTNCDFVSYLDSNSL